MDLLKTYESLLTAWNPKINLVAPNTLQETWQRHFADSAQLLPLLEPLAGNWIDIGSGAGFPGLVIAILIRGRPDISIKLIDSDARKCAFLRKVAQETGVQVDILTDRLESLPPQKANVITARALAPVSALLTLAERHAAPNATLIFLKGRNLDSELTEARRYWHIKADRRPSATAPDAEILHITEFSRLD